MAVGQPARLVEVSQLLLGLFAKPFELGSGPCCRMIPCIRRVSLVSSTPHSSFLLGHANRDNYTDGIALHMCPPSTVFSSVESVDALELMAQPTVSEVKSSWAIFLKLSLGESFLQ